MKSDFGFVYVYKPTTTKKVFPANSSLHSVDFFFSTTANLQKPFGLLKEVVGSTPGLSVSNVSVIIIL